MIIKRFDSGIPQPEDRHIYLKDIIEDGDVDREKSYVIDANYYKGGNPRSNFEDGKRQLVFTRSHGYINESIKEMDKYPSLCAQDPSSKHLLVVSRKTEMIQVGMASDVNGHDVTRRLYSPDGKMPTLTSMQGGQQQPKVDIRKKSKAIRVGGRGSPAGSKQEWDLISRDGYRSLTVLECERLQTLEDGYTDAGISNTQRYKCLGNGWTVDVVSHILSFLPKITPRNEDK